MGEIFAELKRRHMFRVAAAYAVVAWLLLQVVNNLAPGLNLPNWAVTLVIVLLAVGFPIALLFCWIQHLQPIDSEQTKTKVNRLDWILASGLAAVIALILFQQLASTPTAPAQNRVSGTGQTSAMGISLVVLPFANLSGDANQEFFSDGMTDEIAAALARVPSVRMVGRSSAFQFKGQNRDLRAIGMALGANYLIDGSVRKSGDQVRITAQLVQADNGVSIWTDTYDRELRNIFATQSDIATAIAGALRVPLGLRQGETLITNRTGDLDAYEGYLRARALFRARAINDAIAVLEFVVAREPNYAPAWGLLANVYYLVGAYSSILRSDPVDEARAAVRAYLEKSENAAKQALSLDPQSAIAYGGLASIQYHLGKWAEAEDFSKKALELDPNEPDVLHLYGYLLAEVGHIKRALVARDRLRALEPFVPIYNAVTAGLMQIDGNNDAAIAILEPISAEAGGGHYRNFLLARAYAARGQFDKSADTLLSITGNLVTRRSVEDAARLIRKPIQSDAPQQLPALEGELGFVYTHIGAIERVLDYPEHTLAITHWAQGRDNLWLPLAAPIRKTERFKRLVRDLGLVEYWRMRGWPDHCRPVGTDDFACS